MNILIASSISKDAIEKLNEKHNVICAFNAPEEKLISLMHDRDVLIFRSGVKISEKVMEAGPNLKFLIRAGSGIDNLDVSYATKRGILLKRIPEPGAKAVAELSFAFMLALSRSLLFADKELRQGRWVKGEFKGYLLRGKVLGVIGAGNIGSLVGQMGSFWGMTVLGCVAKEDYTPEIEADLISKSIRLTTFDEVVSNADYLSIHVPLMDSTKNLINKEVLQMMKPGSYLIHLARGGVVNEKDLLKELTKENRLRGAALDVHENEGKGKISPFAKFPNVILTPHMGAQTVDSQKEIGERVLEAVELFSAQLDPQEKVAMSINK
ncbi:MAG: hydroxyacid dehydrogenase [Ignavibacteria bacterium]|nr:hydroxyacid dehydrogenase [Ignavibacteria bacterium]